MEPILATIVLIVIMYIFRRQLFLLEESEPDLPVPKGKPISGETKEENKDEGEKVFPEKIESDEDIFERFMDSLEQLKEENTAKEKLLEENQEKTKTSNDKLEVSLTPDISYKKLYKNIPIYLEAKGIQQFYHFTDIGNLKSIIKNGGLYSWYGIQKKGISSLLSSNELSRQLDVKHNLQDYVRLSFYSYHPMSTRLIYEENKDLVWLEIDLDVACWESTLFSNINATDNNVKVDGDFNFLKTLDLDIFKYEYRDLDLLGKKEYQAEILVKEFLPIKYIKNIETLKERYM